MFENGIVALAVVLAAAYAFRALAPFAWLTRRVAAGVAALQSRGWPRAARWLALYAPSGEGCGSGCGGCESAAPTASAAGAAGPGAASAAPPVVEKPLVFQPRRRR